MRAERERREQILKAEGEKKSNILVAEGEKQAKILRAEAEKESRILEAEGKARQIELINNAKPSQTYLTLAGFDALVKVADGQSTKLIVPSNLQDISALTSIIKETSNK